MKNVEDLLKFDEAAKLKSFKKGAIIQRANDLKALSIYVKKGILRSYMIDSSGKEYIYMFAPEGWIIGDIEAMEYNQPAQLYIDCLEDSEVLIFDNKSLFRVDLPKEQFIENIQLLTRRIGRLQRRVLMLMGAPAIDRYRYFLEIYPELPNRIPQKTIAAYLGIMPQTLSTLRRKLAESK